MIMMGVSQHVGAASSMNKSMSKLRFGLRSWSRYRVLHRTWDSKGQFTSDASVRDGMRGHVQRLVEQYQQIEHRIASDNELSSNELKRSYQTLSELEPVVKLARQLEQNELMLNELQSLLTISELETEARVDIHRCQVEIEQVKSALVKALLPRDTADGNSAILEVRAGAGGREASLFTADIYQMYQKYSVYKNWKFEALTISHCESGGYKNASASISGAGVFGTMKFETGVHRVQRIPVTESHGRVHTSTMTVAILPVPTEIDIEIKDSDLRIDTFRSSGAGGQHVNTTDSAVRLTHVPSGIVISMQEDRSQHKNRSKALQVLRARLYEQKRMKEDEARKQQRKQQTGTGERSEKIRTYNFQQDRVTDHRIKRSVNGVFDFISGTGSLNEMIDELLVQDKELRLSNLTVL